VAWPGLVLIQLMRTRRRLTVRTAMLVALFTAFAIGLIPAAAAELTGVPLRPPPAGAATMWVQVVALAAIPGLAAVVELHRAGGTPYPWDPPRRVTWAGPYAYVRNPMQLSMTAILLVVAAALRHWPTAVAGLTSAAVAAGMASGHERSQLTRRWGDEWRRYAEAHRSWLPTWRPRIDHPSEGADDVAVLHLDGRCATCRSIGGWLTRRDPIGLTVADANDDGRIRWRATYRRGADERSGVAAVAAALTHVHLGWAVVGWTIGLPVLSHLAQLVTDVVIVEPHPVGGTDPANR
ncbi:MAG: isoprenylcysteine carboxylmethyltransferase family protein, partial [Actinomycetota bacterium]